MVVNLATQVSELNVIRDSKISLMKNIEKGVTLYLKCTQKETNETLTELDAKLSEKPGILLSVLQMFTKKEVTQSAVELSEAPTIVNHSKSMLTESKDSLVDKAHKAKNFADKQQDGQNKNSKEKMQISL